MNRCQWSYTFSVPFLAFIDDPNRYVMKDARLKALSREVEEGKGREWKGRGGVGG